MTSLKRDGKKVAGQTLLLVIIIGIGIAGMLLLLILPMTQAVQDSQKKNACIKNLKQIGTALEIYRADYFGFLPFSGNSTNLLWDGMKNEKVSLGKLYPGYVKVLPIFYCPTHKLYKETNPEFGLTNYGKDRLYCYGSYFVRGSLQFDSSLRPESGLNPDDYPEKTAWVTDYNIDGTACIAHKNNGIQVLASNGRVYYAAGKFRCQTDTDINGEIFWARLDPRFPSKIKPEKEDTPPVTATETQISN